MNQHSADIISDLKKRINATRRRIYLRELIMASVKTFAVALLTLTVIILLESLLESPSAVRTGLLIAGGGIVLLSSLWLLSAPMLRYSTILNPLSDKDVAEMIGREIPLVSDRLKNMLDLADLAHQKEYSGSAELIQVALEHFRSTTAHLRFSDIVSFSRPKHLASIAGVLTLIIGVFTVVPGTPFHEAALRLAHYDRQFRTPLEFSITITPGNIDVVKGESVAVEATLNAVVRAGVLPSEAVLSFRSEGVDAWETVILQGDSSHIFRYLFPPMKHTTEYRIIAGSVVSDRYTVTVSDRPFVRSLSVVLIPPAYTKLKKERLEENIGDILALPGTKVSWTIVPSKEIAAGSIVFKDGTDIPLQQSGTTYTAEFSLLGPTSYYVELEDAKGNTNQNIIEYKIDIMTDAFPSIAILSPGRNIDVTEAMMLPMAFNVSDDFGITQLQLKFRLIQSRYATAEKDFAAIIPFDSLTLTQSVLDYLWDLSLLGLVPEDVVEYYAEVYDNDPINGPKSSKTQTYLIRLPSLEEVFSDAEKTHDQVLQTMEESLQEAQELKKDLQALSDDMKRNQQMDWQKQKKAEDVLQKYDGIQKQIADVNKTIDDMTKNLQRNNTLSQETLEKYLELQKTLSELNSPEFQKAMKRLQEAMQNVSPEQMREAMQQAQFNEEQFRQSIERTMNLLKRIQIEQKVDELVKRTEQMKQAQDDLKQQTLDLSSNDPQKTTELAQKQDEIEKQLSALQKEMDDLQKKMEEFPKQMPMNKMEDAQRAAHDADMRNAIRQSAEQLRSLQMERALTAQQQASSGISEMQRQLTEMQEQLLNNQMQETMNALRKAMQDLLQLSQRQEQLKNQSRSLDPNSQQFREIAQQQQNLQSDLNNIANGLAELSQQSFAVSSDMGKQIGRAMAQMQQSMSAIEQRNGQSASAMQGETMASLNKAATQMQGAMQQLQQQGGQGGGSLLQQMRGMAMQQQQINTQTQQIGQQGGMSQQQMQELGRLGRQQEAVRKSLEQLQREAEGSQEKNKIMGDLQKIADEMKEVAQQLQQQQVNPNTMKQQERILSRLLQAQRSMRERDYEQRRKSVIGISPIGRRSADLPAQTPSTQFQKDLQRAQESGYSKEYLELIRKYYESLERKTQ